MPPPGKTEGEYRDNISPIANGTKITIKVEIIDKNGTVIGSRSVEHIVGSPGQKFGDDPPEFESELVVVPPPPPPPGGRVIVLEQMEARPIL